MTMLYSYPYYNEVCYKGAALYINCRFSPEEKAKRDPFVFMPFGHGPRNCIGMRLALLEAKMGIIHALKKVTFVKSTETEVGVIYETMQDISILCSPETSLLDSQYFCTCSISKQYRLCICAD